MSCLLNSEHVLKDDGGPSPRMRPHACHELAKLHHAPEREGRVPNLQLAVPGEDRVSWSRKTAIITAAREAARGHLHAATGSAA